jgi:hypothetical protein
MKKRANLYVIEAICYKKVKLFSFCFQFEMNNWSN